VSPRREAKVSVLDGTSHLIECEQELAEKEVSDVDRYLFPPRSYEGATV
jgi:hypothetical protein